MTRLHRVGNGDEHLVLSAAMLFDHPPTAAWTARFIASPIHHLILAFDQHADAEAPAIGFVSGVETTHPDKGTEMFVYELAVDESHRRRGVGTALMAELTAIAGAAGCYGMWVGTDADNAAAIATYRRAGADAPQPMVVLAWTFSEDRGH
ncbi:MAG: GCN5-related protein N-acetyltransferase [Acidimicrobiales bacterium]|nr:GCN5-related protein N-acetyltransferase [Acidimicrobiales bacterium]